MQKPVPIWLILLGALVLVVALAVIFWPWLSGWLPSVGLLEAWLSYLVVDLNIGRWGPVATLLLVAVIELIWALNLGRRSEALERHWSRLDRVHAKEAEIQDQEIELLKEERRALRAELELREDLIREERGRLWAQLEDLQRASGVGLRRERSHQTVASLILRSSSLMPDVPVLSPDARGEWRQIISQLERIEMISSVTVRKGQSAVQLQQHADELLRLGSACYHLGQYERALAHYSKAIELVPNDQGAITNHAIVNYDLGRYQAALQDLERAVKLGENPWIYLYRGLIQERLGEKKRAFDNYTRAIRLDTTLPEGYYRRSLLHAEAEEYEKALEDANRAIELDSEHGGAYTARGLARAALGDSQWALNDLDKGCTLLPQSVDAFYQRALVRHQLMMYDQALADFSRAIELSPRYAPAFLARGRTYSAMGDHRQGIADYDRATELDPKNTVAYHARGQAWVAVKEYRRAVEDYSRALDLEPAMPLTLAHRGSAYEKLGEHERAIHDLDRALALDPNLAIAYYVRGLAYGSQGAYDKASRDLNRAVELDPSLNSNGQGVGTPAA